jgi:tripartite-type tricarboxylate transporter receptor subunit TctC
MDFMKALQNALFGFLIACTASYVSAQAYPAKPVRLLVPYPPGAALDFLARAIAPKLSENMGVSVVIDNKAGASGAIGSEMLARATPDGYTIGLGNPSTHSLPVALGKKLGYDPLKDFTPISVLVKNILCVVVNPQLPVRSVKELVEYARRNSGSISFSSPGSGTSPHLIGELLNQISGINMVHIPYRGGGPAFSDLLSGEVPVAFAATATIMSYAKNGRVRPLAVFDDRRYRELPEVPTGIEALPGLVAKASWTGVFGPSGMPGSVVGRLNAELLKVVRAPDVVTLLETNGSDVLGTPPEDLKAFVSSDIELWTRVVQARNIRAD